MHGFEFLSPQFDFGLDSFPFFLFNLSEHVALYYNPFVELVDFGVNDLVCECCDCPLFYFLLVNLYTNIINIASNTPFPIDENT